MKKRSHFFRWALLVLLLAFVVYYVYPEPKLPANAVVDKLLVYKSERKMEAYSNGVLLKSYTISLGGNPKGAKVYEGDRKTPEGIYTIKDKNPNSGYHKNLGISYPNKQNRARAKELGRPVGGAVKIHGLRNGIGFIGKFQRWYDWTNGCIALTNQEVDELYRSVKVGAEIVIKP